MNGVNLRFGPLSRQGSPGNLTNGYKRQEYKGLISQANEQVHITHPHTHTHTHTRARTHRAAFVYLRERVRLSVGLSVCRSVFPSQSIHEYMLQFYYKQL